MTVDDRLSMRFGALRLARRRGSVRAGAWAAARLRLQGVALGDADARFARESLIRYGRAVRKMRNKITAPEVVRVAHAGVTDTPWIPNRVLVVGLMEIALLLLILLVARPPSAANEDQAGGGSPLATSAPQQTFSPLRGRSQNLVAVLPSPTPAATPSQTEEPPATPAPSAAPVAGPAATSGTGSGGSGGGSGGGQGSGAGPGSGTRTAAPTPTLAPTPTPPPDPATTMILRGRVIDSRTRQGLPNVCVAPGLTSCIGQTVRYTDANGYWELVLSIGQLWDIKFLKTGYFIQEINVPSQPGIHYVPDIVLRQSR